MTVYILLIIFLIISIVITIAITAYDKKKIKEYDEQIEKYNKSYIEKSYSLMELQLINDTYMRDTQRILSHYSLNKEAPILQPEDLEFFNLKPKFLAEFSEDDKEYIKELEGELKELIDILNSSKLQRNLQEK